MILQFEPFEYCVNDYKILFNVTNTETSYSYILFIDIQLSLPEEPADLVPCLALEVGVLACSVRVFDAWETVRDFLELTLLARESCLSGGASSWSARRPSLLKDDLRRKKICTLKSTNETSLH